MNTTKTKREKASFPILVNDAKRLCAAYQPGQHVPPGWRATEERQQVYVVKGYCYAPPWEVE